MQVLSLATFISACVAVSQIVALGGVAPGSAGWLIFATLVTMILQGLIIAIRLLNFGFMSDNSKIVHIVVSWNVACFYHISIQCNSGMHG